MKILRNTFLLFAILLLAPGATLFGAEEEKPGEKDPFAYRKSLNSTAAELCRVMLEPDVEGMFNMLHPYMLRDFEQHLISQDTTLEQALTDIQQEAELYPMAECETVSILKMECGEDFDDFEATYLKKTRVDFDDCGIITVSQRRASEEEASDMALFVARAGDEWFLDIRNFVEGGMVKTTEKTEEPAEPKE